MRARRTAIVALFVMVAGMLSAGVAAAVSGGGYQPSEQDCSVWADANNFQGAEPGCHNFKLNVEDSSGHRYVQAGILQEAQNENPHAGDFKVNTNSDGGGLGVAGGFNSNWNPFTPDSCGVFDIAVLPFDEILFLTGQSDHQPCTITPSGQTPDPGLTPPTVSTGTPDGSIAGLAQGARLYLGADDNLDTGEHDGVHRDCTGIPNCTPEPDTGSSNSANGPSDGGAITVNWHPGEVATWLATLAANPGDPTPFLTNPVPVADAGFGSCADNICLGAYSRQTTLYQGCSTPPTTTPAKKPKKKDPPATDPCANADGQRNVYDYSHKDWDPEACSSGSVSDEQQCNGGPGHPQNMDGYRQAEAKRVVAEPGVVIYGDPDPQSSPIGPYPLPAAYVGTCGVTVGGGQAQAPASPITNSAGQASVSTGC
jgi:hypothetical protein